MREVTKTVEVNGRKFQVEKFSAMTGSYVCIKILGRISHVALGIMSGELKDPAVISGALFGELNSFSKAEFLELQQECLAVTKEVQNIAGVDAPIPVLLPDGKFGVADLEKDMMTVMALTVHVMVFNLTPFFDASILKGLLGDFPDLAPQKPQI